MSSNLSETVKVNYCTHDHVGLDFGNLLQTQNIKVYGELLNVTVPFYWQNNYTKNK